MKTTLPKETLIDILWGDHETGKIIEDTILENDRWSILHEIVFSLNGTHYTTTYRVGATEQQDESPWEYDPEDIACVEVHQVEKIVKVWKPVEDKSERTV